MLTPEEQASIDAMGEAIRRAETEESLVADITSELRRVLVGRLAALPADQRERVRARVLRDLAADNSRL